MSGTTVLVRFRQFQREQLLNLACDFDRNHQPNYAGTVWLSFHNELGNVPHEAGVKGTARDPKARAVSDAWTSVDKNDHICPGYFLPVSAQNLAGNPEYPDEYRLHSSFVLDGDRSELGSRVPNAAFGRFHVVFRGRKNVYEEDDDTPRYNGDTAKQARTAVQDVMSSAEPLFTYQHRKALFVLLVNVDEFRVMRFDRSGIVITEPVNYLRTIANTRALLEVTYAFSKLSRASQGIDTSAVRLLADSCGWKRMDLLAQPSLHDISHTEGLFDVDLHDVFVNEDVAATYGALSGHDDTDLHRNPLHMCSGHTTSPPVIPVLSHIRQKFRESLVSRFPRYRLTVDGHDYLVGKPVVMRRNIISRGNRGYIALDWETQRLVFLKDCWRSAYEGVELEGAIISKLNEHKVTNVPTVVRYGDVYDIEDECVEPQTTDNSLYNPLTGRKRVNLNLPPFTENVKQSTPRVGALERWIRDGEHSKCEDSGRATTIQLHLDWNRTRWTTMLENASTMPHVPAFPLATKPPANPTTVRGVKRSHESMAAKEQQRQGEDMRHMVHTRLVVKEICLPLLEFTSSRQLVRLVYGCVIAHGLAYKRCQYIHGDISECNLLIYPHVRRTDGGVYGVYWRGMLSDWELAWHTSKARVSERSPLVTWAFLSAYRQGHLDEPTTIPDELESFVHVLIYCAVIRIQSVIIPRRIKSFIEDYFTDTPINAFTSSGRLTSPHAKLESIVYKPDARNPTRLRCHGTIIVFSTPDGSTQKHIINSLITRLLSLFNSRYVINRWERRHIYKDDSEPSPRTYAKRAALDDHYELASILYTAGLAKDALKYWPPQDVVPDRRDEEARIDREGPTTVVWDPKDVPMFEDEDDTEAKNALALMKPDSPPPMEVDSESQPVDNESTTGPTNAPDPPVASSSSRPAKRRRKDPVVDEAVLLIAESPMQRVTRSRSTALAAASTRVTRSQNGKLPNQVSAGRARNTRAASGRETRRRAGATIRDAPS
ncbi:hypothetical protein OH76DRAFT_1402203 [Lentinus brumalis]|uniref:Fungal-type protein kinase domain-containing protein n=1 Tax=Lentinus brumalis TaxID=2498619 RepID=A0A371DDH0_9APHY|nr:hypothetical protein OH76DRAFT_1402203 [Polyporus brumalis]